jgi:hypothetical protein
MNGNHRLRARSRPRQRPRQRLLLAALSELSFVTVDVAVVVNVSVDGFSFGCGRAALGPLWFSFTTKDTTDTTHEFPSN